MKANVSQASIDGVAPMGFRELLQSELAKRCARNPQYSLRAFALDLESDHATLSQLIRGRRSLTPEMIERLGRALGLTDVDVAAHQARERLVPGLVEQTTLVEAALLTEYARAIVTEWQHFAILELTRLRDFKPDVRWIARVLDESPDDVTLAVNRLIHLGLLEMKGDTWRDTGGYTLVGVHDFARQTVARLFVRVEELVGAAQQRRLSQDHSSTTIAVNAQRIEHAIQKLHAFRRELVELLESDSDRDEVYRIELHFYPVTKPADERREIDGATRNTLADHHEQTGQTS